MKTNFLLIALIFIIKISAGQGLSKNKTMGNDLLYAARTGNIEFLQDLLIRTDVDYRDNSGNSVLHYAAWFGQINAVNALIRFGINVNIQNNFGHTPLQLAATRGFYEIVELLLKNKAEVAIRSVNGGTSLHSACKNGHVNLVKLLIENGIDVNLKEDILFDFEEEPDEGTAQSSQEQSTKRKRCLYFDSIIKESNLSKRGKCLTALHWACAYGYVDVVVTLLSYDKVNKIAKNAAGDTPLHLACLSGHKTVVQILLEILTKEQLEIRNLDGKTAYEISDLHIQAIFDEIVVVDGYQERDQDEEFLFVE